MIATVDELREASALSRKKFLSSQQGDTGERKSKEDILKSWAKHFEKTVERAIKDAVRAGAEQCCVQLPWQPENTEKGKQQFVLESKVDGYFLRTWVKKLLPGCEIEFVEEEQSEGNNWFMLEISWTPKSHHIRDSRE